MTKEAKPDAWMPLFIGDYKKDTGRLTRDQHGGYLLLIMEYWNTGPLPDDDEELAAISLADDREWKKLRPKLLRFFRIEAGLWRHKRIDAELEAWTARKTKAVERAQAAAAARWDKETPHKKPRRKHAVSNAPSIPPSIAPGNAPSTDQALLDECPSSSPLVVESPKVLSTHQQREGAPELYDGSGGLAPPDHEPEDTERGWLIDVARAEVDLLRCKRSDPDLASELAEFIATGKARAGELRRERLSTGTDEQQPVDADAEPARLDAGPAADFLRVVR